ncbi:molecular chaperone HtpG, partial [Nocardia gipuzkoensis]
MTEHVEQLEFQAETHQLLELMIHSVYSNKDIFLRELISNASDALDKLRLESFRDKDLEVDTSDLHIELEVDRDNRIVTVRDNGIGMARAE